MNRRWLILAPALLAIAGCSTFQQPKKTPPLVGSWGGNHAGLVLDLTGGQLQYDCAAGRIDGAVIPNEIGEFHVNGSHTPATGGPLRQGEEPPTYEASYQGAMSGDTMTLRVIVRQTGLVLGPFTLRKDAPPVLTRCL